MNSDKAEKRAETKINSRFTKGGKGDAVRVSHEEYSKAGIWCDCIPARFRDKCQKCNDKK